MAAANPRPVAAPPRRPAPPRGRTPFRDNTRLILFGIFILLAVLVIGVAVPTPGAVGSFHEAYRIAVTAFFHAPNNAAVSAALVLHGMNFVTSVVPGVIVMTRERMSVAGLGRLAGVARQEPLDSARGQETAGASTDEMPVLRPSGR